MARPVYEPGIDQPFGGSEVRAYWFSTGLASMGWQVEAFVNAHNRAAPKTVNGVSLRYHRMPRPIQRTRDEAERWRRVAGWPKNFIRRCFRSIAKRCSPTHTPSPGDWGKSLGASDAYWFACFGVHAHAAAMIRQAKARGRASVLFLASDTDLDTSYIARESNDRNPYGQTSDDCGYCLEHASVIIAQTNAQQERLRLRFGRHAAVVRNPIGTPCQEPTALNGEPFRPKQFESQEPSTNVLWIGRADCFSKRADLALQIARRCPERSFTMIMNRRDPEVYRRLTEDIPPNVRLVSSVRWDQTGRYFRDAGILLNTSDAEGFPNTFLQAAARGIAILACNVDPDGMLATHACGWNANGDVDQLVRRLQNANETANIVSRARSAGPAYVKKYHCQTERCDELSKALVDYVRFDQLKLRGKSVA